ncbi:hypothetical protein, conserved [Eimeria necatrix]|uniref:Dynein heavy chain tail domain-containing protein n=1 Tax=Eimeria necatrix TaxID=51315 RepID=U6N0X6_9EIME|nr:hypothetical protein, conserved [Eimeria necatrix]CDJ70103.1 hypothetical protein, conserved [Eimeria necatrix]
MAISKGKQLEVSDQDIFSRMDLFCRRIQKLISMVGVHWPIPDEGMSATLPPLRASNLMCKCCSRGISPASYSTIQQFSNIADQKFEGMDIYVDRFKAIFNDFKVKRHDLLDFYNNRFDRDFVEFSVRVSNLESSMIPQINEIFETTSSIDESLRLLQKLQETVFSENLKAELKGKISLIIHRYSIELVQIQEEYERHKTNPPPSKDMPPIPNNIIWARDLLKKIEVAETLVEYELRWHQAWTECVQATAAGLNNSILVRNPNTGKLSINFDGDIARLIREAKVLERMSIDIPESGRIVFLREKKLKGCFDELKFVLDVRKLRFGLLLHSLLRKLDQYHGAQTCPSARK